MKPNESKSKFVKNVKKAWSDPVGSKLIFIGFIAIMRNLNK